MPAEPPESLYSDAELYERLVWAIGDRGEADFYAALAGHAQARILELGSGTGRLSLPLAERGFAVTGIDNAPGMVAVARRHALRRQAAAVFGVADLRDFELGARFDLIVLPNNTLGHVHTLVDLRSLLRCVQAHLAEDGLFVIDMFNPSPGRLALDASFVFPVLSFEDETGASVDVTETSRYDVATQTSHLRWHLAGPGVAQRTLDFKLRVYFPQELDALLSLSGFAIQARYGDYDRAPFGSSSPQQLLVCRRLSG